MAVKKIIDFLILRPAFSSKNVSSLGLVALFFAIYVFAGGKVAWVPKVGQGDSFGTVGTERAGTETAVANGESQADDTQASAPQHSSAEDVDMDVAAAPVPQENQDRDAQEAEKRRDALRPKIEEEPASSSPGLDALAERLKSGSQRTGQ